MKNLLRKIGIFTLLLSATFSCNKEELAPAEGSELNSINMIGPNLSFSNRIPSGGNSWVVNDQAADLRMILSSGIHNWTDISKIVRVYFRTNTQGTLNLGFNMKAASGPVNLRIRGGNTTRNVTISNASYDDVAIGTFNYSNSGYQYVEIEAVSKTGAYAVDINDVLLGGSITAGGINFVPSSNTYFGRRGPSVNLAYPSPAGKQVEYFYNEVTVPAGSDVLGSYFMVGGHAQGYFGMQVNSESERRILFSIWSSFETDDPGQIPPDARVIELERGSGVTVRDFGNEGSGKQSFKNFIWQTGTTYRFLVRAQPSVNNSTDYTGWFFAPEVGEWQLISKLRRPYTSTYLTGLYSFLENFKPETGNLERDVVFSNQWTYNSDNTWSEITRSTFNYDATARNGDRLDYYGAQNGNGYLLRNCGFFSYSTASNTSFTRAATGTRPNITFNASGAPTMGSGGGGNGSGTIDKGSWRIIGYRSQEDQGGEGSTGRAADILDNNVNTYWHSCWRNCTPNGTHFLNIDMGSTNTVSGFTFVQRQNLSRASKDINILVSNDNSNWTSAGTYELSNTTSEQVINLASAQTFRYIFIYINSSHDGSSHASLAEIGAFN